MLRVFYKGNALYNVFDCVEDEFLAGIIEAVLLLQGLGPEEFAVDVSEMSPGNVVHCILLIGNDIASGGKVNIYFTLSGVAVSIFKKLLFIFILSFLVPLFPLAFHRVTIILKKTKKKLDKAGLLVYKGFNDH